MSNNKILVISAVNIVEGGTLTILEDAIKTSVQFLKGWKIYVLVNNKKFVKSNDVKSIEFPKAKYSWFLRLYYEWFVFFRISKSIKPDLWLSLHDITPRVMAKRQVVYCHNPSPFYRVNIKEALQDPKFALFTFFYKYLYGINIKKNYLVIVQQDWIRKNFYKFYGNIKVIVTRPDNSDLVPKNINFCKNEIATFFILHYQECSKILN